MAGLFRRTRPKGLSQAASRPRRRVLLPDETGTVHNVRRIKKWRGHLVKQ
ncbi:MAG: hypothetical protein ABID38_00255 [Candidatus Diapherotrites archaeon]